MNAKVERIETFVVSYLVRGAFKFFVASPGRPPARDTVLVKVIADDGTVGWGQSVPSHRWSYETVETVRTTIDQYLAPVLIGIDALDIDDAWGRMNQTIAPSFSTGQPICKSGVDLALFDLAGKLQGQTALERWGRRDRSSIEISWTLNPNDLSDAERQIAEAHQRGYRHFNVKVAPNPDEDLELCRLARSLAPNAQLWVDANGGYELDAALAVAPRFADLGVRALEQPFPANRLGDYAQLRRQGAMPILMDEGIVSCVELEEFHRLGLLDGIAVKVSRCGGLTEARRQVEFVQQNGLLFYGSGLTDPDVSLAASVCLFAAFGLDAPAALNGPQFLTDSILANPLAIEQGVIAAPDRPGLGVDVDESKLAR